MDNTSQKIRILLVEDDVGDALLAEEMLAEIKEPAFSVTHVDRIAKAVNLLRVESFGAILLDLSLPDGQGMELVQAVRQAAPGMPIVVMSGQLDDELALQAVQAGVQDYCVKGYVDSFQLGRTLRYAIERKRIEDALLRSNTELAVLFRVSSMVSRSIDMQGLLADIIDTLIGLDMLHLKRQGAILSIDDDGSLKLLQEIGASSGFVEMYQSQQKGECLFGMAAEGEEMVVSADDLPDARHPSRYARMESHGHIAIPLKSRKRVVGVLCLETEPGTSVSESVQKMLLSIGEQIGIAVENARLYEETRRLALHDPLTGLANRRHLDLVAERSFARARRDGTPFAIIMLDLDHFKHYNDTHGHSAGDQLLVAVAETMKKEVRETSLVVRYGGEEFLILLSDIEITVALAVAERIRRKIQENTSVTVSLGVSWTKDGARSLTELIAAADAALYQAKNSGRNKVVSAGPGQKMEGVHV